MPILACEPDVYSDDLLSQEMDSESHWLAIYTRSRQEKVLQTNLVSQRLEVGDGVELNRDLRQTKQLLQPATPLQVTNRLPTRTQVRIKHAFSGVEASILKHRKERDLVVAVNFLQQEATAKLRDVDVESPT